MKYNKTFKEALRQVREDGHVDVASAIRKCKTSIEDASQLLSKLQTMDPEGGLPSWWNSKLTIAANSMNKLRDYLLVPSMTKEDMKEFKEAFEKETDEQEFNEMINNFEDIKETIEELLNNAIEELSCINYVIEELLKKDFTVDEADLEFEDCKFVMIDAEHLEDEYFERYMLYRKQHTHHS